MSFFDMFKSRAATAPVARERLQILLAHERMTLGPKNLIAILRDEILATVAKHIDIAPDALKITMGQHGSVSTLEIDVELPTEKIAPARHMPMRATA
ncbi:cell division topological specificity factor MinE [Rhodoblastus sphagnicola]|uniref:Cell division topological specificity factor n=1 Tax=Rhodoblastus sphagnicola TaxID=333368 RepID=A0A2S6NA13_9HYPH|nr:cell division topological specificity factor MinE [Rhodoblastus sphagnicola]MBB4198835.1 cell division topological specificity factor [Rhodoblastus sphagnicola]PPQ31458.1 cell division topological specificity factor MinE [Rhodoblastus sphagnicola]